MFISESEKLIVDWDYNKNAEIGLFPDSVSIGSHKRVHWKCHICGGEWNTVVKERRGCPYCTGFKVLEGFNDLATTHPLIAAEWAPDNKLKPTQVTAGSNKVVSWICERGHIWRTSICARVKGDSCSYCSGKKVMAGFNDLASLFPEIAREWDVEKNGSVRPEEVTAGSNLIVWWKCSLGHEWSTRISQRTKGTGCPVCSNKTVLVGFNDVASQYPAICAEWDYEKNSTTPQSYTSGSNYKAWWKCERGHSWKAPIVDRCRGDGCPKCSEERHVSFPEKAVLFYIRKIFPEAVANYRDKWCSPYELDIYIPNIAVAIEYDGIYGHSGIKGIERDIRKNDKCASHEVALIRIRENGCPLTNSSSFDYIMDRDNNIAPAIAFIIRTIGEITGRKYDIPEVDIVHDSGEIYSLIEFTEKQNSLALAYPDIAKMWNTSKNGTLSPEMVSSGSQKKVWWRGECGHEWQREIYNQIRSKHCPYCIGKRVLFGYNDLFSVRQDLSAEWDYDRNRGIDPSKYTCGSSKKVWWKCINGHSWEASIASRVKERGCPICANKPLRNGYNNTALLNKLAEEWVLEKNNKKKMAKISLASHKKYWWRCGKCGYCWQDSISNRLSGKECPTCYPEKVKMDRKEAWLRNHGSFADKHPELIGEWISSNKLSPYSETVSSNEKIKWKCAICDNIWEATIASRSGGRGCPICAKTKRSISRQNNLLLKKLPLSVSHPEIAREWDYTRNENISPDNVTAGSGRRVWWKCSMCGAEWDGVIGERTRNKASCPQCRKRNVK